MRQADEEATVMVEVLPAQPRPTAAQAAVMSVPQHAHNVMVIDTLLAMRRREIRIGPHWVLTSASDPMGATA